MHKILVIGLYFPLDAVHVSHCISPSGATFIGCTLHLVYACISRRYVWLIVHLVGLYTYLFYNICIYCQSERSF